MGICFIFMFTVPKPVVPLFVPDRFVYVTSFAQAYSTTVNNFSKFLERITHVRLRDHFGHTKLQKRGQTQSKRHYASLVQKLCTAVGAGFAGRWRRLGSGHDRPDKFSVFSRLLLSRQGQRVSSHLNSLRTTGNES